LPVTVENIPGYVKSPYQQCFAGKVYNSFVFSAPFPFSLPFSFFLSTGDNVGIVHALPQKFGNEYPLNTLILTSKKIAGKKWLGYLTGWTEFLHAIPATLRPTL